MFPFIIIGLFFAVVSLFTGLLAMCTRIGSYLSGFVAWLALTFQVITTCLMTYVQISQPITRKGVFFAPCEKLTLSLVLSTCKPATPSIAMAKTPSSV